MLQPDRFPRWDVLAVHLDEAAFLSAQWDLALRAPDQTLVEVEQGVEQRLQAHVEALSLAGPRAAERLLVPALAREEEPEFVRAAGLALLTSGDQAYDGAILQTLIEGTPLLREAAQRALQLGWRKEFAEHLRPLLATAEPQVRTAVLEVLRFQQIDPGELLPDWMGQAEMPAFQAAALRAAHAVPGTVMRTDRLQHFLGSPEAEVREAALILGLARGMRVAWHACKQMAGANDVSGHAARLLLALGGEPRDIEQLKALLQVPALRQDVLWALGFSGRVAAAEACLPWMRVEALASTAAEAFCAITGLRLEGSLARERDDEGGQALPPLEEDLEHNLQPREEESLVLPNPEAVEAWWVKARKDFEPTGRYLGGKPFSTALLIDALVEVPMRRRSPLALELAIRSQGRHQVEVRTWARLQRRQLLAAREAQRWLPSQPFPTWMRA